MRAVFLVTALETRPDVVRADWRGATPALEPDDGKRANVRAWRRELAEWMRAHGIAAHGPAWELATTGERDLTTLRRTAADTGDPSALARHWDGHVMPHGLAAGDGTDWGTVVGAPVTDPDTGAAWITAQQLDTARTIVDVELPAGIPVRVIRGKGALS